MFAKQQSSNNELADIQKSSEDIIEENITL